MKNAYLSFSFFIRALIILGRNNNNLTESQSEMAGYCGTILSVADDEKVSILSVSIMNHADERGFKEPSFRRGVKRATNELKIQGWSDGDQIELSEQSINDCREVLNW